MLTIYGRQVLDLLKLNTYIHYEEDIGIEKYLACCQKGVEYSNKSCCFMSLFNDQKVNFTISQAGLILQI